MRRLSEPEAYHPLSRLRDSVRGPVVSHTRSPKGRYTTTSAKYQYFMRAPYFPIFYSYLVAFILAMVLYAVACKVRLVPG